MWHEWPICVFFFFLTKAQLTAHNEHSWIISVVRVVVVEVT